MPRAGRARWFVAGGVIALAAIAGAARAQDVGFAGGAVGDTAILTALEEAHPERFRAIGTTSVGFQVDLAGRIDAAFRPESRAHPRGWLAEVAAYRVGCVLGLDDVPPAVLRTIERGQLRRRLDGSLDEIEHELAFTGNVVRGAFVYWVPDMVRAPELDTPAGIRTWSRWLAQGGEIPAEMRALARDVSNVLVFDFLIGNRDRWSGGNARPTAGGRLVIRDHNLAFPGTLDEDGYRRMLASLRRTTRFSRSVIERLIAMDEAALRAAVADREPSSLLDERQIRAVTARRETVLSYVGALIETHGAGEVLAFE